jgi:hypothetical protein
MSWVRFDDQYPIHRKVEGLSDAAFRLHTSAIFWCARNETDGFVGADDLANAAPRGMSNPEIHVPELTRPGRDVWEVSDGGWVIHDYLDYQFSKARLTEDRKKNALRQQRFRTRTSGNRNAVSNGVSNAFVTQDRNAVSNASLPNSTDADRNAVSNAAPSRPDPSRKEDSLRSSTPRGDPAFAAFYGVYPKHVGRKAAEAAWVKALKGGADPDTVIAGAQRYAEERFGQEPRYTKAPATWLNQGCWEDDPQPRAQQGHIGFRNPSPDDYYGDL